MPAGTFAPVPQLDGNGEATPARLASGGHLTPAIASTQALLRALEGPDSPEVRRELAAWQTEATKLLAELIENEQVATRVVMNHIIGYSDVMPPDWILEQLREILEANVQLAHAEY